MPQIHWCLADLSWYRRSHRWLHLPFRFSSSSLLLKGNAEVAPGTCLCPLFRRSRGHSKPGRSSGPWRAALRYSSTPLPLEVSVTAREESCSSDGESTVTRQKTLGAADPLGWGKFKEPTWPLPPFPREAGSDSLSFHQGWTTGARGM